MNKKKNLQDLLKDESFLNWANQSNKEDIARWEAWLEANPDQQEMLEDAKIMAQGFRFKKSQLSSQQINNSWDRFSSKLNARLEKKRPALSSRRNLLKIAATILVLIVAGWMGLQFFSPPKLIVFETNFNETRSVNLPDGSSVLLNTNSKLAFYDNWLKQDIRILQLEGEAYFDISSQPEGKLIRVQTRDLTVEVIGTAFNCNGKRKNSIVSLIEGKVQLIKPEQSEKMLDAGQTAWFNDRTNTFEIAEDKTDYWKAWTLQKWSFGEGTPMTEILKRIEETYGLTYKDENPEILERKASGDISIESREVLLEALSFLLGLEMKVNGKELLISSMEGME